ncbi:AAEL001393-PA, partial [Aedes aegypti]
NIPVVGGGDDNVFAVLNPIFMPVQKLRLRHLAYFCRLMLRQACALNAITLYYFEFRQALEASTTASQIELEAEEEPTIELPPPMKPIQDTTTTLSGTPSIGEGGSSSSMGGIGPGGLDDSTIGVPSVSNGGGGSSCAASSIGGSGAALIKAPTSPQYFEVENLDENLADEQGIDDILRKRMFALKELVTTEEAYVNDLSQIVNGYIAEIRNPSSSVPIPDDLKGGKERMVFGNIEAIYEWHRDHFLKSLQKCQLNPHELGPLIKRSERKLHMYVVYCQNKPVSEHIVQEHMSYFDELRLKLKYKLCLGDMLIKPVQRIMKYELLLKDILKHTQRAGLTEEIPGLKDAMHIMRVVPKAANDMMDVGRLQKFEGKITAQGKLLLHGPLYCVEGASSSDKNSYNAQKPKELHVFLFEQNIIFAEIVGKKTQFTSPSYIYKAHIQVNKMTLQDLSDQTNGNRFSLCSIDPQRSSLSFICTAPTIELHNEWLNTIRNILQTQNDFLKAIQSPIAYQKELTKDS